MKKPIPAARLLIFAAVLVAVRLALMFQFPVIADEAYYFYWGTHPAGGYYDLPPMVGWWETFLTSFSLNSLWLRLPNMVTMVLVAFGVREWTRDSLGAESSALLGLIFFFLPVPFLAIMVAPDLPLLFFTFYSSIMFYGARKRRDYLLSGALWGAAFLSKYFAVFSLPALLIWHLLRSRERGERWDWSGLLWFSLGAIPFVFQHLLWNALHCWANFVFNLVVRQRANDGPWGEIMLLFGAYLLLMSTPFLWKGVFRRSEASRALPESGRKGLERYFLLSWAVPILIFALTALIGKGQGLHWYVPYLPFFVMWVGLRVADEKSLRRRAAGLMTVSALLSVFALWALANPDREIRPLLKGRHSFEYELAFRTDEMLDAIFPSLNGVSALALDSYSLASVFDLELKRRLGRDAPPLIVMGPGTRFGRVFDFTSDWKSLAGRSILLVARGEWSPFDWGRFFDQVESKWIEQRGVRYWVSRGIGFKADLFREEVLRRAYSEFYPPFHGLPCKCELRD